MALNYLNYNLRAEHARTRFDQLNLLQPGAYQPATKTKKPSSTFGSPSGRDQAVLFLNPALQRVREQAASETPHNDVDARAQYRGNYNLQFHSVQQQAQRDGIIKPQNEAPKIRQISPIQAQQVESFSDNLRSSDLKVQKEVRFEDQKVSFAAEKCPESPVAQLHVQINEKAHAREAELEQRIFELQQRESGLKKQLMECQGELFGCKSRLDAATTLNARIQTENDDLQARICALEAQRAQDLQTNKASVDKRVIAAESAAQKSVQAAEARCARQQAENQALSAKLVEQDQQYAELSTTNAELLRKVTESERVAAAQRQRFADSERANGALQQRIAELERQICSTNQQNEMKAENIAKSAVQMRDVACEADFLTHRIAALSALVQMLQNDNKRLNAELAMSIVQSQRSSSLHTTQIQVDSQIDQPVELTRQILAQCAESVAIREGDKMKRIKITDLVQMRNLRSKAVLVQTRSVKIKLVELTDCTVDWLYCSFDALDAVIDVRSSDIQTVVLEGCTGIAAVVCRAGTRVVGSDAEVIYM